MPIVGEIFDRLSFSPARHTRYTTSGKVLLANRGNDRVSKVIAVYKCKILFFDV